MANKFFPRPSTSGVRSGLFCAALVNIALFGSPGFAEESRQLESHEHGVGELNIAVDGNTVAIELHAPGADIVGFEYVAESAEDRTAIEIALTTLSNPLELFVLPPAAECRVTEADAHLETEGVHADHEDHDHAEEHDDHAEEHDDHADHEDHDHAEERQEKEHHPEGPVHSGFHATYTLACNNPSALSEIKFTYFDVFENALELEVQVLSASGAQAFEVERGEATLDLRGMF